MNRTKSGLWAINATADSFQELSKAARTLGLVALADQLSNGASTIKGWTDIIREELDEKEKKSPPN